MNLSARSLVILVLLLLAVLIYLRRDWILAHFFLWHMESENRIELQVPRVVRTLEVRPGQRVADIGAGSGLFSFPLARQVGPEGTLFVVDVNPDLVFHLETRAQRLGLKNVKAILASPDDPRIPEPVDLIFICDTLHHISDRAS